MALTVDNWTLTFSGITTAPISVAIQAYSTDHIFVYFGKGHLLAQLDVDYTVALSEDFLSLTVTPKTSLINKINTLISIVPSETNVLTVSRKLPGTNSFIETDAFFRRKIVEEIDMLLMRMQQSGGVSVTLAELQELVAAAEAAALAAVPAATTATEQAAIAVAAAAAAAALDGVVEVIAGANVAVTGTPKHPIVASRAFGPNLLPNTNWQLFSAATLVPESSGQMNSAGTAIQAPLLSSGWTPSSGQPTINIADTGELYNDALVTFGAGHNGLSGYALRVFDLIPNVSFKVQIPFSRSTPGSSHQLAVYPCGLNNTSFYGPDGGWTKTTTLVMWPDDFATNACPGTKRVLGLRKAAAGTEVLKWLPREKRSYKKFRGKELTFGVRVRQKVSGGAGRLRWYVDDGVTKTYTNATTGSTFVDAANNNFEFLYLNFGPVALNSTKLEVGAEFAGNVGDIVYIGKPTLKEGTGITEQDLGQNPNEILKANTHWNPPCTVPFVGTLPGAEIIPGSTLCGWADIDLEAISYGQVHGSISRTCCKIETTIATVGQPLFVAALDVPAVALTFGPQTFSHIANLAEHTNMTWLPLIDGQAGVGSPPACFAIFGATAGLPISNITFDFDSIDCG